MLKWLLMVPIVFMVNQLHLDFSTGIPAVNVSNILFGLCVAGLVIFRPKHQTATSRAPLTIPMLLLFGALTVSSVIGMLQQPGDAIEDITYLKNLLFYPLLYFVYRRCGQDEKNTRQLIIMVAIVAAVAGLEAVREGLDYGFGNFNESRRASGPFGTDFRDSNRAGVFYAMFTPFFVALALFLRGQKLWRIGAVVGIVLLAIAIMATYSRQSYLIALVCVALLLIRRNVILATLIGVLMVPAIGLLPDSVTQRVAETKQQDAVGDEQLDDSTASRFEIWAGAFEMWQDHPLGVGLNRFKRNIGTYVPRYAGYDAHSIYMLTLAETGLLGLGALLFLLASLLWHGVRMVRAAGPTDAEIRALTLGFTLMVVAVCLGNAYGSPFYEGPVMANFWILCGLLEHYVALRKRATAGVDASASAALNGPDAAISQRFPLASRIVPGRYGGRPTDAPDPPQHPALEGPER
ncbi:MAG: O-antigen ligase family protein [Pseudoxanthomonas sp.]